MQKDLMRRIQRLTLEPNDDDSDDDSNDDDDNDDDNAHFYVLITVSFLNFLIN